MNDHGHDHGHGHGHGHEHDHTHDLHACDPHGKSPSTEKTGAPVITVRASSGLAGDMLVAGLVCLSGPDPADTQDLLASLVADLRLPVPVTLTLERRFVRTVAGWGLRVDLPHEHAHRTCNDIVGLIEASTLTPRAARLARECFWLLATAEGRVHGKPPEEVTFHEVGALDSIADICVACALFDRLGTKEALPQLVCGPLPLADGGVACAHGWVPTPAPAVIELLEGVIVCGFAGQGETVTPTALSLVKTFGAVFGPWPFMRVTRQALVHGSKVFPDVPNGAVFALGTRP